MGTACSPSKLGAECRGAAECRALGARCRAAACTFGVTGGLYAAAKQQHATRLSAIG